MSQQRVFSQLVHMIYSSSELDIFIPEGFTCPDGKSSSTITVGAGESLAYSSQEGARYTSNVDCVVKFRKGEFCDKLRFSCESFSLGKGDTMLVKKGNKAIR